MKGEVSLQPQRGAPADVLLQKMKVTKKGCLLYGCLTPIVIVAILILGVIIASKVVPSKARSALPDSATDVQEYYSDAGFTGDFVRVLKARLPKEGFPQYAKNLGLTEKYDPSVYDPEYNHLNTSVGSVPAWWDEPRELDNCYFQYIPDKEYVVRVKWKDGWVYFLAVAW